jgi:hypothetical protein
VHEKSTQKQVFCEITMRAFRANAPKVRLIVTSTPGTFANSKPSEVKLECEGINVTRISEMGFVMSEMMHAPLHSTKFFPCELRTYAVHWPSSVHITPCRTENVSGRQRRLFGRCGTAPKPRHTRTLRRSLLNGVQFPIPKFTLRERLPPARRNVRDSSSCPSQLGVLAARKMLKSWKG